MTASGQIIFDANDPGDKDSFPLGANPPIPPASTGRHTLDNVVFSNAHKKPALRPSPANDRRNIYIRLPGLLGRSIRPRRSISILDATFTDLVSAAGSLPFTRRTTGAAGGTGGAVTALGRTFTSDAADTLQSDGVVPGDILILSDAGGSNGRYVVVDVPTETTALVDRPFPATDADVSYTILTPNNFVDAANRLIDVGALEVRNDAGTLVAPVLPTA